MLWHKASNHSNVSVLATDRDKKRSLGTGTATLDTQIEVGCWWISQLLTTSICDLGLILDQILNEILQYQPTSVMYYPDSYHEQSSSRLKAVGFLRDLDGCWIWIPSDQNIRNLKERTHAKH
jgi:hypothetical protein